MGENTRVISTDEELKIFSDPYRMKIIKTYQSYDKPLTVKQCADLMGEVPAKVHYHVKKLLSIDILKLDHIEVINGINAKYYKLTNQSFTVKLENDESDLVMYKQLNKIEQMIANMIDEFKADFYETTKLAAEVREKDPTETGMITSKEIFLTEEEYKEVMDHIGEIINKYGKYSEGKKKYSYLGGFVRKK